MEKNPSSLSASNCLRPGFRPRRPHQKSRNGCLTCKQRRKKCDEKRACCTVCEASLRVCAYATNQQSPGSSESGAAPGSPLPSPPSSLYGTSSNPSACPKELFLGSSLLNRALVRVGTEDAVSKLTDADLYFHFLNHTCKSARRCHKSRVVLQIGIAKLALDSEPVSHSVLALSAACLCCDTISTGSVEPETVRRILDLGLQHHTLALEQMQAMTSLRRDSDIQPLLVCALMLVPFALAFQHIQQWVLDAMGLQSPDLLTPRDAILLLRGIGTTIVALNSNPAESRKSDSKTPWDAMFSSQGIDSEDFEIIPERTHTMFPILSATFHQALSRLSCRIESALASPQADENTVSTFDAYEVLNDIISNTFSDCKTIKVSPRYISHSSLSHDSLLARAPGWLRNFVLQSPQPTHTEPLVRSFLVFFSNVSQTYVDLLLPLLERRADSIDDYPDLMPSEILALDIYAHWLVIMLLVENEAWWVGNFPFVALQGLVARYGDLCSGTSAQEQWWPASMLEVATRLRHWK